MKKYTNYEIWLLGYDDDGNATDYEKLLFTGDDRGIMEKLMREFDFTCINDRPRNCVACLEKVEHTKDMAECKSRLMETEV